ncbi:MAG TPA: hypothetical protein VFA78_07015 [Chloroflexota bacterium]|nr:hypothetical protein [Chloroflexota bacterium]
MTEAQTPGAPEITQADIDSLRAKLETFSQTLTPAEQTILNQAVRRSAPEGSDVEGYMWFIEVIVEVGEWLLDSDNAY